MQRVLYLLRVAPHLETEMILSFKSDAGLTPEKSKRGTFWGEGGKSANSLQVKSLKENLLD